MSFTRLGSGEFPPLDKANQKQLTPKKSRHNHRIANSGVKSQTSFRSTSQPSTSSSTAGGDCRAEQPAFERTSNLANFDDFQPPVGVKLNNYTEDLQSIIDSQQSGDFILAPIEPVRTSFFFERSLLLPDLALPNELWQTKVALDLGYPRTEFFDSKSNQTFDRLLSHAFYLSVPIVVISCPNLDASLLTLASTVNYHLAQARHPPTILFKFPISQEYTLQDSSWCNQNNVDSPNGSDIITADAMMTGTTNSPESGYDCVTNQSDDLSNSTRLGAWQQWNALRSHLIPDPNIGVCLEINDELTTDRIGSNRWLGEPVRMVIFKEDQFVTCPDSANNKRLLSSSEKFIEQLLLANSFKISFIFEGKMDHDAKPYLTYLQDLVNHIALKYPDGLRDWNERIQPPLQPLSSNLDSSTYNVFEMDKVKYSQYKLAVAEAIQHLLRQPSSVQTKRRHVLMVLGAGRGPIVDSCIEAIDTIITPDVDFKIYALDKNHSAISSLQYKKKTRWAKASSNIETEVVESDMRSWHPSEKADIIVTELLGSFSDNELSPECIDGVWRFAKPETISIPQEYSSYVAPISSYRLHQQCHRLKSYQNQEQTYDQIYVTKLSNFYLIDRPKELFTFRHENLDWSPELRDNQRYTKLSFSSQVDTVCHGFAGYFKAILYGDVTISTLIDSATADMHSWFPAFIPLEQPTEMRKVSEMVLHFWRKESSSQVWYEWALTNPVRTKIHSQSGKGTAMSKVI